MGCLLLVLYTSFAVFRFHFKRVKILQSNWFIGIFHDIKSYPNRPGAFWTGGKKSKSALGQPYGDSQILGCQNSKTPEPVKEKFDDYDVNNYPRAKIDIDVAINSIFLLLLMIQRLVVNTVDYTVLSRHL